MRALSVRGWASVTALSLLVAAVAAALIATVGHPTPAPPASPAPASEALGRELARCRGLGVEAEKDFLCHAAWDRSRRQFFGEIPEVRP